MEAGYSGAMGSDEKEPKKEEIEERANEKKKLNDDLAVFMRKCSESDVPRYYAMMKNYVKLQQKRKRADAARKRSDHGPTTQPRKKADNEQKEKPTDGWVRQGGEEDSKKRGHGEKGPKSSGSVSGQRSQEPADCGCRRRRRSRRRCCVRRPRRSCRRRRRRSRCRRRRRRSCRRRRRRRR